MSKKPNFNDMIELNWYKIGYQNYDYYLSRKYICYSGKRITFKWNDTHFQNVLIQFSPYLYPRNTGKFNDYLKEHFNV